MTPFIIGFRTKKNEIEVNPLLNIGTRNCYGILHFILEFDSSILGHNIARHDEHLNI